MRNVELVVHVSEHLYEQLHLFLVVLSAEMDEVCNFSVAIECFRILGIVCNNLGQIHCIGCAMNDMRTIVGEDCTSLMGHGMDDPKQSIGKSHAGQALRIVHLASCVLIAIEGIHKVFLHHFDCMKSKRIGEFAVGSGYIGLDGMCHCIHSCMGDELLWHCLSQLWINDRHIWCDLKVRYRVFDSLRIVSDD